MAINRVQSEIRAWSTGFFLVVLLLPFGAHSASPDVIIAERNQKLTEVTERFDREMAQKQSLYKSQMVSALKELRTLLITNELRLRTMNPPLTPRALAAEYSKVADFVFSAYGVSFDGPFTTDMPALIKEVEESGVFAALPVSAKPSKQLQQAIVNQQALMVRGEDAILSYLQMSAATIKQNVIDAAVVEIEKSPNGDIFVILYQKLEISIQRLESAPKASPRMFRRGNSISIG